MKLTKGGGVPFHTVSRDAKTGQVVRIIAMSEPERRAWREFNRMALFVRCWRAGR